MKYMNDGNLKKAEELLSLFEKKGLTLATAESCTGGMLGKYITSVSGASEVYLGGVISYSNSVKEKILGVERNTLDTVGAVSYQTAEQMAKGALKATGSDVAVSVTGIAGPTGAVPGKPVGTVFISVADKNGRVVFSENHFVGNREEVREQTTFRAFEMLCGFVCE